MRVMVTAKHFEPDPELSRYISKKLEKLERYIPRHARQSAHIDVILHELKGRPTDHFECEFIIHLPHEQIVAKESTINMFAAVDIVEAKVKNQLRKYKARTTEHDAWRSRLWRRLSRGGTY